MFQAVMSVSCWPIISTVIRFFRFIKNRIDKENQFRRTYNELNQLSDSELNDIGINRSQIHAIASEVLYNNLGTHHRRG